VCTELSLIEAFSSPKPKKLFMAAKEYDLLEIRRTFEYRVELVMNGLQGGVNLNHKLGRYIIGGNAMVSNVGSLV